jgi:hypothetical protein
MNDSMTKAGKISIWNILYHLKVRNYSKNIRDLSKGYWENNMRVLIFAPKLGPFAVSEL